MPADDRISRLLDTLSNPLSQNTLELLSREFDSLAQDRSETLAFFVLHNVSARLASEMEGEAVTAERFEDLTREVAPQIADILLNVQRGKPAFEALEQLVSTLFRNLGLYRH